MMRVTSDPAIASVRAAPMNRPIAHVKAAAFDAVAGAGCCLTAYRLRFDAASFGAFLPGAVRSLPILVASQLLGLLVLGVYRRDPKYLVWRVAGGAIVGTALGAELTAVLLGFQGISRISFLTDAVLFGLVTFAWRSATIARPELPAEPIPETLEDRADSMRASGAGLRNIFHYRELLRNLVLRDLKLKYRGSAFGFLWSLMNPLLMIVVYTMAFTFILHVRASGFVFYLLLGILTWTFFANSASMSTGSLVDSSGLMKSVSFPRVILPIATVLFNLAQFLLTVLVFLPLMLLIYRVPLSAPMLLFPVFLFLQILFTIGAALILSTGTAFFRDIKHLLEVALSVMFWTTPILYELRQVSATARGMILLSPMSSYIAAYHEMFYYREWPDASIWLVAVTYAVISLVVGTAVFVTYEDQIAEYL